MKRFGLSILALIALSASSCGALNITYTNDGARVGLEAPFGGNDVQGLGMSVISKIRLMFFDDSDGGGQERYFKMLRAQGIDVKQTSAARQLESEALSPWPVNQVLEASKWLGSKAAAVGPAVTKKVWPMFTQIEIPHGGVLTTAFGIADACFRSAANVLGYIWDKAFEAHYCLNSRSYTLKRNEQLSVSFPSNVTRVFVVVCESGDNGEILAQWSLPDSAATLNSAFDISTIAIRLVYSSGWLGSSSYTDYAQGNCYEELYFDGSFDHKSAPKVDWGEAALRTRRK